MMKVCLISAPTANQLSSAVGELDAARIMGELAPVGILSLAAVLEAEGLHPEVVDLNRVYYDWLQHPNQDTTGFCTFAGDYFAARDFDLFGFSTVCSSYPLTLRIATEVKRAHPNSLVALGGPQASVVDVPTMRTFPSIDLIVRGEAEETLPALVTSFAENKNLANMPGITLRANGEIVRNANAPVILDLDSLPFPAFHLFPDVRFCRHFPLELGRGCPFACTFCSTNDFFRRRFRLKTPAHMISEMRHVKQIYGINSFELVHDMFTVDRKRVVAFCEALLDSGEEFYWGCSARTDCVDEELIELMSRAGCRGIFFGIESGSAKMQTIIDKGLELSDSRERIVSCDKFKINTAVSLMAGFPDETQEELRKTAAFFVESLRCDHADPQLSILAPLSNTPIQQQYQDSLVLKDDARDMSYRGWPQEVQDYELIANHPEIFSSFYSVPLPFLEHELVKELRDFLLCGMRAFRFLLLGLHQDSGDILGVFQQWQRWRATEAISFSEGRTAYYAHRNFTKDFLRFVRLDYIPTVCRAPIAIEALVEFEEALLLSNGSNQIDDQPKTLDDFEQSAGPNSRPRLLPGVRVITLSADYQEIIRRLKEDLPLVDVSYQPVTIAVSRTSSGAGEVRQLSPLSATLLGLCAGRLTVKEIESKFLERKIEVAGVPPGKACLAGIEILRQQRFIALV